MEFFLNRAELSLNSANSGNQKITEAWIGLNLKIHVSCWCYGSMLLSHTRAGCVAGLSPFTVMTNIFLSVNSVKHLGKTPLFPYGTFPHRQAATSAHWILLKYILLAFWKQKIYSYLNIIFYFVPVSMCPMMFTNYACISRRWNKGSEIIQSWWFNSYGKGLILLQLYWKAL